VRSLALFFTLAALFAQSPRYGVGRTPSADEIKQWDITVMPDGTGLPEGSGAAASAKELYSARCAKCHGADLQGRDAQPLAGGQGTLTSAKPLKTIGSYWPYATTVFDYVNRAMPFDRPGTLTHDQVYSLTAYLLYRNGIISETTVLDRNSLPKIKMPNHDHFVKDPRPDVGKR